MKADQINRFMRVNGRKNLWLLRNTNQLYEHAVKSYYQRSNSLLPYNPKSQEAKTREENRAPVRTLTSQRERSSMPEYPRNHQQMAEQATCANSLNLLNTVMQANRRRSMSFTGGVPSYIYNNGNEMSPGSGIGSGSGSGSHRLSRQRRRTDRQATDVDEVVDELSFGILNGGRSLSLPPRSTLELGMSYRLNRDKGPPSQKHHINAFEKSTSAAVAALARHKNDPDKLMVVDQALKDRLAVRFDRHSDDQPISARFGLDTPNRVSQRAPPTTSRSINTNTTTNTISKEQTRFQTLGERIRQFEVIQFADGPVTYQAFNRRQGLGRGRGQALANDRHIPKQEPCLSFRNVLHTNHRQRSLHSRTSEPQLQVPQLQLQLQPQPESKAMAMAPEVMQLATPPLGPLKPLAPNWRPQQQQPTMEPSNKLSQAKIKRIKLKQSKCDSSNCNSNSNNIIHMNPKQFKVKAREKPKITRSDQAKSLAEQDSSAHKAASCNRMSRSSHMSYIQDSQAILTQSSPQLPQRLGKHLKLRKLEEDLPKQPHVVKGAHHLLAASASQVSAYRRAFKNRQQILQAEMLHIHVQDQPQHIHQPNMPMPSKPKIRAELKEDVKTTTKQQLKQQLAASKSTSPSRILTKQERAKSLADPSKQKLKLKPKAATHPFVTVTVACNSSSPKHRRSTAAHCAPMTTTTTPPKASPSVVLDKPSSSSLALQKLQQQQLHQQLRQRRLQPLESLWRYNH